MHQPTQYPRPDDPGAMSVGDFCRWAGISRASFYRHAAAGTIRARKIGRKTVILQTDAQRWLSSLPTLFAEAA